MEIVFDEEEQEDYETEIIDDILTFDELLEDEYYNSEFEKRVQERLDIYNSHPDVKGEIHTMDDQVQNKTEGKIEKGDATTAQELQATTTATGNPTVEATDTAQQGKEETVKESAREMTAEQFDLYNETLRLVSKTAKASLPDRYNAFEDAEIKTLVKQQVMQGERPSVKELAASVVTRLTHTEEATPPSTETTEAMSDPTDEMLNLKAENALLKAGILTERIEAAKKLFIAEGAHFDKVGEFVAAYPEWGASSGRVVFGKAQPLADKTAPTPDNPPVLNDFERKVKEARKKAGLE